MITTVIASSSQLFRNLLSEGLMRRGGLTVTGTASGSLQALALTHDLKPDVVVVRMGMPGGERLIVDLVERGARPVVIGPCAIPSVAVIRDGTIDDVAAAIHAASHGAVTLQDDQSVGLGRLTPSEQRVLGLVAEGLSNKEIARTLGVATATVKHHVHSVLRKLGVTRRGQAAALLRGGPQATAQESAPWTMRST